MGYAKWNHKKINKKPLHENTTGHFNATSLKLTPIKSGVKKAKKVFCWHNDFFLKSKNFLSKVEIFIGIFDDGSF